MKEERLRCAWLRYNARMNEKVLSRANPYLRDPERARRGRVRSLASSTAIETGESIAAIEARIKAPPAKRIRVKLA